jgi:hypothetical protein
MSEMLQLISDDLENQGNWRRDKAEQYPDDIRNVHAAAIFDQLLDQVGKIKSDNPLLRRLDAANDQILHLGNVELSGLIEDINEYHRDIGFHRFPEFIADYLGGLIEVHERVLARAKEAAERTQKVLENRVRRKAARLGYRVTKSRERVQHSNDFGAYMLLDLLHDDRGYPVIGWNYDATLEEIEGYLYEAAREVV